MCSDGREEELSDFICDIPGCPNVATHVLGGVREHPVRIKCATLPWHALKAALAQTEEEKRVKKKTEKPKLLFTARGRDTPFAGWSKAKPDFDSGCPLQHWTLHDLRRTCATNLAALGVPVHVTEKLLNHVSGSTAGIVAVYQRHAYLDEMRNAVQMWERQLRRLLGH